MAQLPVPLPLARLAPEIWDTIIDQVCELENGFLFEEERYALVACSAVCRAWLPRARYNLFRELLLHSRSELAMILATLSNSPCLRVLVQTLQIYSQPRQDPSWIIHALLDLHPILPNLQSLSFHDLDLVEIHPAFFKILSLYRSRCLESLTLQGVRYSRYSQLTRCASATYPRSLAIEIAGRSTESQIIPTKIIPGVFAFPGVREESEVVFEVPWAEMGNVCRYMRFPKPVPSSTTLCTGWKDSDAFQNAQDDVAHGTVELIHRFCENTADALSVTISTPCQNSISLIRSYGRKENYCCCGDMFC